MSEQADPFARERAYYKEMLMKQSSRLAQQERSLARLRHSLLQREQGFALLASISQLIGSRPQLERLLSIAASEVVRLLDFGCSLAFLSKHYLATQLDPASPLMEIDAPFLCVAAFGSWGDNHPMQSNTPATLTHEDVQLFGDGLVVGSALSAQAHFSGVRDALGFHHFVACPVRLEEENIGFLVAGDPEGAPPPHAAYDEGDLDTFRALSLQVTAIVDHAEHARLQQEADLKDTLFSEFSHEFRTPIALTMGVLQHLSTEQVLPSMGDSTIAQEALDGAMHQQEKLLALVDDILALSRAEAISSLSLHCVPMNEVNGLLHSSIAGFQLLAMEKGLRFSYELAEGGASFGVMWDQRAMERVLTNLLSNALKFTETGAIGLRTFVKSDEYIVEVFDSGMGIPSEQLGQVFERYHRAHTSAAPEVSGTGIGLALVKRLVTMHRGWIGVESVVGEGSVFRIRLPLVSVDSLEVVVSSAEERDKAGSGLSLGEYALTPVEVEHNQAIFVERGRKSSGTILYVDDNPELRRYVFRLLSGQYRVLLASDGQEALSVMERCLPSLVLSDLSMPRMDGLRFLERVRSEPAWLGIPFVLLTARTDTASRLEGFSLGASDYIEKPFSEPELLSRVGNLVRGRALMEKRMEDARDESAKSILLQRLSHEFRTPLNAILGYSELILDMSELEGSTFKWEDELNRIREGGERLLVLVEQLLDVSVAGGKSEQVELSLTTFDVGGLLGELVALVEQRAVGRGVSFSMSCAPGMFLHSDRVALSKVLYNILENACRFSNKGNVFVDFVEASADCAIQKEEGFVFRISDSGMGIEEEHLRSIFEPFRQVDESHTRPYDGAGLGLSIARDLVRQLGGTIEARNRPEEDWGAEFVIWLPG